jgi:hypothetical protein
MEPIAFKDIDGDLLHLTWVKPMPYIGASKYENLLSVEIEMVTVSAEPCIYFNADQLRDLAKKLVEAADFLDKQGA